MISWHSGIGLKHEGNRHPGLNCCRDGIAENGDALLAPYLSVSENGESRRGITCNSNSMIRQMWFSHAGVVEIPVSIRLSEGYRRI